MTSDIDELLADLRVREAKLRTLSEICRGPGAPAGTYAWEADGIARRIARLKARQSFRVEDDKNAE